MAVERIFDGWVLWTGVVATLCTVVLFSSAGILPGAGAATGICANPGADGPQPALGGTVNTYFPGTSAAVAAGATTLTVGASIGAATPIAVGDKLLIIQMQTADLDSSNTDAYGDGAAGEPPRGATNWASAGSYEFAVAANSVGTAGGTLQLSAGTGNAYVSSAATAAKGQETFQVVRVPQYSSATLGSNLTATPWNGAAGGIVAIEVAGALDLNGFRLDASAVGFRGGVAAQLGGGAGGASTDIRTAASNAFDGGKAEGVAGTPRYVFDGAATTDTGVEGYPNGSFARGAPANAGGGGTDGNPAANDQNSGGGGGGNGGAGGQGGNSWFSNLAVGGAGGAAVPSPSITKVVLGGGGGGATRNNAGPSSGGVGGGIVLLDAGSITGTGEIRANGGTGQTAANDGGGGGGAGGGVTVTTATGTLSGLTVTANGGDGGGAWPNQPPGAFPGERHGPGGGGGGGVILFSTTGATTSTSGGTHGVTTTAGDAFNATDGSGGSAGFSSGSPPGAGNAAACSQPPQPPAAPRADLSVTKTTSPGATAPGDRIGFTLTVHNEGPDPAADVVLIDTLPSELVFVSATGDGWACAAPAPTLTCTRAQLASGATAIVTLVVTAPRAGTFTNSARVGASTADPSAANNIGSSNVQVGERVDLAITKAASAGTFVRGKPLSFTIVVRNTGPDAVAGAEIRDLLPAALTDVEWRCSAVLAQCADAAGVGSIRQTVSLPTGGSITYLVTGVVTASDITAIANRATVSVPTDVVDTNTSNNAATARVRRGLVPTQLAVTVTPHSTTVVSGAPARFAIVTRNAGSGVARAVVTCIRIPPGASLAQPAGASWPEAATAGGQRHSPRGRRCSTSPTCSAIDARHSVWR